MFIKPAVSYMRHHAEIASGEVTRVSLFDVSAGSIPKELGALGSLEYLLLDGNQLTGEGERKSMPHMQVATAKCPFHDAP